MRQSFEGLIFSFLAASCSVGPSWQKRPPSARQAGISFAACCLLSKFDLVVMQRTLSLLLVVLLTCLLSAPAVAQVDRAFHELHLLDPSTVYSFRGLDGQGFLRRQPVNIPDPVYTGQRCGLVVLRFTINAAGQVGSIRLEPNQHGLATIDMIRSAQAAVLQWRFDSLPAGRTAGPEEVRVLIQFNRPTSDRRFSEEGNVIIDSLGNRRPLRLVSPEMKGQRGGVVTAELTIDATGQVAWVDRYYGATPDEAVDPHLGLKTHAALSQWQLEPRPEAQGYQRLRVVFRYLSKDDDPSSVLRISSSDTK